MEKRGHGRLRFENRPEQTAKYRDGDHNAAPVESAVLFRVVTGQQNREHNQYRDRADINKNLNQPDELRAKQKEKRGQADEDDDKAERGVHQFSQNGRGQRSGESENWR